MSTFQPRGGMWALKRHGTANQERLVYVLSVSPAGRARFIMPNTFCGAVPPDKRHGWTKPASCRVAELSTLLMSWHDEKIAAYVEEIGFPGGAGVKA